MINISVLAINNVEMMNQQYYPLADSENQLSQVTLNYAMSLAW